MSWPRRRSRGAKPTRCMEGGGAHRAELAVQMNDDELAKEAITREARGLPDAWGEGGRMRGDAVGAK